MRKFPMLALVLIVALAAAASAQPNPAKGKAGFTFTQIASMHSRNSFPFDSIIDLPNGAMVVSADWNDATKTYDYFTQVVDAKGKAGKRKQFYSIDWGVYGNTGGIWVEPEGGNKGSVLVFVATSSASSDYRQAQVRGFRFDANGKKLAGPILLATFSATQPYQLNDLYLVVARGSSTALVFVSAENYINFNNTYGPVSSFAYMLQTDLTGALVGQPQNVALPNGGALQSLVSFKPYWNGNAWFLPVGLSTNKLKQNGGSYYYYEQVGIAMELFSITPSGTTLKSKFSSVFKKDGTFLSVKTAAIIPSTGASASSSGGSSLLFGIEEYDPNGKNLLEMSTGLLYQRAIGSKGTPKGSVRQIPLPARKHTAKHVDSSQYYFDEGEVSFSDIRQDADGTPVVLIYRGTNFSAKSNQDQRIYDHEIGAYGIDLAKGSVTQRQWTNKNLPSSYFYVMFCNAVSGGLRYFIRLNDPVTYEYLTDIMALK